MHIVACRPGQSVSVESPQESWLITLLQSRPEHPTVNAVVVLTVATRPGELRTQTLKMAVDCLFKIGTDSLIRIISRQGSEVRFGFEVSPDSVVKELEVRGRSYHALPRPALFGEDEESGPDNPRIGPRPGSR